MILVTGSVQTRAETLAQALAISIEHVQRSRQESGCLSHDVSQDAQDPLRLLFVERWASQEALLAHFAVPESRAFAKALGGLAAARPTIEIYKAEGLELLP